MPSVLAHQLNLLQDSDANKITAWVDEVLNSLPEKVVEFKKGKKGLIGSRVSWLRKSKVE